VQAPPSSLLGFPSTSFFTMLLLDSIFETHRFHVSHLRMAQDELFIFGGLIINTNSYQTKNGT
jgi:hypothetical protein